MTTPTISSVTGTVASGQTLTITGTSMVQQDTTNWDAFFKTTHPNASSFEGASITADGYLLSADSVLDYTTAVKLLGTKSVHHHGSGSHIRQPDGSGEFGAGNFFFRPAASNPGTTWTDVYFRIYSRWNRNSWPDEDSKFLFAMEMVSSPRGHRWGFLFGTFACSIPDAVNYTTTWDESQVENNRWYCVEIYSKVSTNAVGTDAHIPIKAWVDDVVIIDNPDVERGFCTNSNSLGWNMNTNSYDTNSTWNWDVWQDGLTISSTRVGLASKVEIGNSATYASATKRYQAPEFLSDTSNQIKCDLTGLGAGPYYLFVTNNLGETSAGFNISGGSPDTTPPNLSSPSAGTATSSGCTGAGFTTDDIGTGYWTTYTDGATPTAVQVKAHNGTGAQPSGSFGSVAVSSSGAQTVSNLTGLSASTAYDIYYVQEDPVGNLSTSVFANLTTAAADTTEPTLSNVSIGTPTTTGADNPHVDTNEAGVLYWSTYVDGSAPLNTDVRDHIGTGVLTPGGSHGSVAVSAPGTITITDISGLDPATNYDLYFVEQDGAGNLSLAVKADLLTLTAPIQTVFFTEDFNDNNFTSRNWYDIVGSTTIDTAVHAPVGASAAKFHFNLAGTVPSAGYPGRHLFTPSATLYVSWYMKFGTSTVTWQGSGQNYHPHIFHILTDADGDYASPPTNYLTIKLDSNVFRPEIVGFDYLRIYDDAGAVYPHNNATPSLLGTAAAHAVMGGNGFQATGVASFFAGPGNTTYWRTAANKFTNNTWHHCEAYLAMNSIVGGIPQADGILRYTVDDVVVTNETAIYLRTAQFATQKFNQIAILPYIGDGSPIAQDFWLDNLIVADQPPEAAGPAAALSSISSSTTFLQAAARAATVMSMAGSG